MLECVILNILLVTKYYYKYIYIYKYINTIKVNNKYLVKLLLTIEQLKKEHPKEEHSIDELEVLFNVLYPVHNASEKEYYDAVFAKVRKTQVDSSLAEKYITQFLDETLASEVAIKAIEVSEGRGSFDDLTALFKIREASTEDSEVPWESSLLKDIHANLALENGLSWRLNTLNRSLGPLRKGNFGFILARPEVGKTSFIASEVSHMAAQTKGLVLHVNNEEESNSVYLRYYSAVLGITQKDLWANPDDAQAKYLASVGDRIKIYGKAFATKKDIEAVCKQHNPCLIIFDQLDKVGGFNGDILHQALKEKYQWARELAKEYGPVIGVSQAGASGENKTYLDMNDIDNSHTGKPGEADWILGIGKLNNEGYENIRYLHLMKNKLPGDKHTEPAFRHIKAPVRINPEIARYEDAMDL